MHASNKYKVLSSKNARRKAARGSGLSTYYLIPTTTRRGSVLIEIVIGVAIFAMIFAGMLASLQLLLKAQTEHKAKIGALALMNDGLERARSLTYANVGVVDGTPSGILPATESITLNATTYTRAYAVYNIDDSHDGLGASDSNGKPNDYKKVKVTVTWSMKGAARSLTGTSLITPDGIEP